MLPGARLALLAVLLWPTTAAHYPTSDSTPDYSTSGYSTATPEGECPSGEWVRSGGRCYWRSRFVAPWGMLGDLCQLVAPGATPVSIHDYNQNDVVGELVKSDSWIGLRRYGSTRDWTWSDGSPFDFTRIYYNDGGPKDQCMSVYPRGTYWKIRDCAEYLYFVCQVDQKVSPTTEPPETTTWHPWGPTTEDPRGSTTRDPWWTTTREPWWPTTRDPWGPTTRDPWGSTTRDPWGPTTRYPWDTTTRNPWGPTTRYPWPSSTSYPWWPTTRSPYWTTTFPPYSSDAPTSTPCSSSPTGQTATPERTSTGFPWWTTSSAPATTDYPSTRYWANGVKEQNTLDKNAAEREEMVKAEQSETGEKQRQQEGGRRETREETNVTEGEDGANLIM